MDKIHALKDRLYIYIYIYISSLSPSLNTNTHVGRQTQSLYEMQLTSLKNLKAQLMRSMLFLHHELIDDIARVADYVRESGDESIVFQTVQRDLRPPTDEERWAIVDCIDVHHRSHLWNIMSRGIQ